MVELPLLALQLGGLPKCVLPLLQLLLLEIEVDDTVECILHSVLSEILSLSARLLLSVSALGTTESLAAAAGVHFMPRPYSRVVPLYGLELCTVHNFALE